MLESLLERRLFSLAEQNHLRSEAMHLFEEALTKGDDSAIVDFIQKQLVQDPPRLQFLRDLADDLLQRLLSLREYHFDVRDRVVSAFKESYQIDITPLTPPDALHKYHHLTTEQVLNFAVQRGITLDQNERLMLSKMIEASLQMAAQLHTDIQVTDRLHNLVLEWLDAMSVITVRRHWQATDPTNPPEDQKLH